MLRQKHYFEALDLGFTTVDKKLWETVNLFLPSNSRVGSQSILGEGNKLVNYELACAKTFNDFFNKNSY